MILSGVCRIGNVSELRAAGQTNVINLSLAFNVGWGAKKDTTWIRASLWGKQAESLQKYLTKGSQIFVSLEDVKQTEYNGKTSIEAKIVKIELIGGNKSSDNTNDDVQSVQSVNENDIPF